MVYIRTVYVQFANQHAQAKEKTNKYIYKEKVCMQKSDLHAAKVISRVEFK
jgi:hypothetical protein